MGILKPNYKINKMDFIDKKGNVTKNVCNLIQVKEFVKLVDAKHPVARVVLQTFLNGKTIEFIVPYDRLVKSQESLMELLSANEFLINFKFANPMREWIFKSAEIAQSNGNYKYFHQSLGFMELDGGGKAFMLGDEIINGKRYYYNEPSIKFRAGTSNEYDEFLKTEILPYAEMRHALVFGLSSLTASYIKDTVDIGTIIINFCGASSTGKTTASQFIASLWGQPKISNLGLVRTFAMTPMSIIKALSGVNGVAITLDDATASGNYHNKTELIYQIAQCEPKTRLKQDGSFREVDKQWSGVVIMTSETPIISDAETRLGVMARVIEVDDTVFTQSASHAERIKEFISNHYGHIGRHFTNSFLNKNEGEITKLFKQSLIEVREKLVKKDGLSHRLSNKIAVFRTTAKLIRELLQIESIDPDEITSYLVERDQRNVEERHIGEKAIEVIRNFIQLKYSNFEKLNTVTGDSIFARGDFFGRIEYDEIEVRILISSQLVSKILRDQHIYEKKTVDQYWINQGYIIPQSGRSAVKVASMKTRAYRFRFEQGQDVMLPWNMYNVINEDIEPKIPPLSQLAYDDSEEVDSIFSENEHHEA